MRNMFHVVYFVLLINVVLGWKRTDPANVCEVGTCCKTDVFGEELEVCPINSKDVIVKNYSVPQIISAPAVIQYKLRPRQSSSNFDIKVLSINSWLLDWPLSTDHDARMDGIFNYLQTSDHDIVFMQENWLFNDYQRLRSLYPYSTLYGTPGSIFCPQLR